MIGKWLARARKKQEDGLYRSGYDYTVGCLVRGEKTEEELSAQADNQFDRNAFELGMQAALRDLPRYVRDQEVLIREALRTP